MLKTSDVIWQDAQHQVLFETLELIKQPGSDRQVIVKLRDYTETHFEMEERYMLAVGFPDRDEHVEAHDRFRHEIGFVLEAEELDDQFRELSAIFLAQWLRRHVFGSDKVLADYILSSTANPDSIHFSPESQVHQSHKK